jgi:hypothetical protein
MVESDIHKIEKALGVVLPLEYRQRLLTSPFEPGTDDVPWDNADAIIDNTKEYREGYAWGAVPKWPKQFLWIGDDGTACSYVLDLSIQPSPVLLLDHGNPNEILETLNFEDWITEEIKSYEEFQSYPKPTLGKVVMLALIVVTICGLVGIIVGEFLLK